MLYVGEIRMFAGTYAPNGWAFCDGQPLLIEEHDVLFQLIGTTYGGDGESTFHVPDLSGRLPVHQNVASGSPQIGEMGGVEEVALTASQIPTHTHPMAASTAVGSATSPEGNVLAASSASNVYRAAPTGALMSAQSVLPTGGSQPHSNMQPYTCIQQIISLYGVFPFPA